MIDRSGGAGPRVGAASVRVGAGVLIWLALAVAVGASGLLRALPPPVPPVVLLGLTVGTLLAIAWISSVRAWAFGVDPRALVALHVTRFVGVYFLILFQRAQLPFAFAVPGGWGDVVAASGAAGLLAAGPPTTPGRRAAYFLWNLFGLLDFLYVGSTAARLAIADPESMAPLLRLPLSLLPTFLVPILMASHVVLGIRLARPRPARA